jgi:mRNA interferase RelE/StbE
VIEKKALKYLMEMPEKSQRIVKDKCKLLAEDPFPGKGVDKELFRRPGHKDLHRMHVGRSYTVFYRISQEENAVRVLSIMTIEQAHKKYGRL